MEFARKVEQWAADRNLIAGSTPEKQFKKLMEEVLELRDGLVAGDGDEITDGIGDCAVVLVVIAKQVGVPFEQCCEAAWQEIKDRKGRMVDGVFVKEGV